MRSTGVAAAAAAAMTMMMITGCGGGSDAATPGQHTSMSPTASRSVRVVGLKSICRRMEADLAKYPTVPSRKQLTRISESVHQEVLPTADLEAKNALQLFLNGVAHAADAYAHPRGLLPKLEVSDRYDGAVSELAKRCWAAGSSAFQ